MQIVYAPDARAEALARTLAVSGGAPCVPADRAGARAMILVTGDYYSRGFWQLKRALTACAPRLEGALCACLVLPDSGSGAELAIRSLAGQLLGSRCAVYLCASVGDDGKAWLGGCTGICKNELTPLEFYTKFSEMAVKFG